MGAPQTPYFCLSKTFERSNLRVFTFPKVSRPLFMSNRLKEPCANPHTHTSASEVPLYHLSFSRQTSRSNLLLASSSTTFRKLAISQLSLQNFQLAQFAFVHFLPECRQLTAQRTASGDAGVNRYFSLFNFVPLDLHLRCEWWSGDVYSSNQLSTLHHVIN